MILSGILRSTRHFLTLNAERLNCEGGRKKAKPADAREDGRKKGKAKPRNPRHFDTIEGRRNSRSSIDSVKDTFRHYIERLRHFLTLYSVYNAFLDTFRRLSMHLGCGKL